MRTQVNRRRPVRRSPSRCDASLARRPSVSEGLVSCNAELGSTPLARRCPFEIQSLLGRRALTQVQVDQRLIGDGGALGQGFEVADRLLVEADRNLLLQALCVRVRSSFGEVVVLSHRRILSAYAACSPRSAFRAEMTLMTSPAR